MKTSVKVLAAVSVCAIATAALAQTPKPNADAAGAMAAGPYFSVGPEYPTDPNAAPQPGRGAGGRGQQGPNAAGGRGPAANGPSAGRGGPGGGGGAAGALQGGGGFGTDENAPLLWEEHWNREPLTQPMVQKNLGNQNLKLHIYGDAAGIRKTQHPNEDYTYTGETRTNWAITVSDPQSYWDLRLPGKITLRTRNTGFRETHIIIKTADGEYFASEEGSPESNAWINRDYILSDIRWRNLTMVDAPSNVAGSARPVEPNRAVLVPTSVANPDLSKVDEVGFSDLMEGGFIPATTRVNAWALFGKKVPR